mmetsp:Transcript_28286/g.91200  ORF Transcript_28286/g.91200 Transcript_28286/m.91200 type:complete len:518 (+) Transcript_28286:590-2143(+)
MTETVTAAELPSAKVDLTLNEAELVEVLVEAAKELKTTVRICGGWVRDKALGRLTKDIDVALDNCSGAAFAEKVSQVLSKLDRHEKKRSSSSLSSSSSSKVGVIAANPDQSKHLETATMRLCGVEVDFVNLRSEAYADDSSRVPTSVEFGTPMEDAMRRDFTVNALMFNVHDRTIEDHTNKGWDDLRAGLLRTPLEPKVTLLDDPLRALRGVRFAARYGFRLDDDFRVACRDPQVKAALLTKVSRERVGKETRGAFASSARGCVRAIDELRKLKLAASALRAVDAVAYEGDALALVVHVPAEAAAPAAANEDDESSEKKTTTTNTKKTLFFGTIPCADVFDADLDDCGAWRYAARCVAAHALVAFPGAAIDDAEAFKKKAPEVPCERAVVGLAASLLPFAACTARGASKKKDASVPVAVMRDGLKLPNADVVAVQRLLEAVPVVRSLAARVAEGRDDATTLRRDVGAFLFQVRALWRDAADLARAADLAATDHWNDDDDDGNNNNNNNCGIHRPTPS